MRQDGNDASRAWGLLRLLACAAVALAPLQTRALGWAPVGRPVQGLSGYTQTELLDGRVLIAGGQTGGNPVRECYVYDPSRGKWTTTGSLNAARAYHTATLLQDGEVLVAGGAGAWTSLETWSPATETWTTVTSAAFNAVGREGHSATLLPDGRVLFIGGHTSTGTVLATARI